MSLDNCEQINVDEFHLAVLNEVYVPMCDVKPGSLLACPHPQNKKWTRCYVISICHQQANVAFCDTGEMSLTKKFKCIPEKYKSIPVITFEAELKVIYPHGKLQHLIEHFGDYIVSFEQFKYKPNNLTRKKMKLTYKNVSINFIINKWNPQNSIKMSGTYFNSLMKNGSAVVLAKVENYDWRHIFVRSIDQFVNICKQLQTYCETASKIDRIPIVGDIIAVKCVDKFYRGKIIDLLDDSNISLYLIDAGYVISTSTDCIVDLSKSLQKIPSTVWLVGLKDITMKPWNQETFLYINTLFENSTTMIMEYADYNPLGLDSVTLTVINNNEDVNDHLRELLNYEEDPENCFLYVNNPVEDLNSTLKLHSNTIIPVKVENSKISERIESNLLPGSVVYMAGFVDFSEVYIRKYEDHNEFNNLLDMFNIFCFSAIPVSRPLEINEIIGVKSKLDDCFYRGKVLKQIDHINYQIEYIDYSTIVDVPIFYVFEIPEEFMIPSNAICVALKGLKPSPLNSDAFDYIKYLLTHSKPMIIDFSPVEHYKNVILKLVDGENVNERLLELVSNDGYTLVSDTVNKHVSEDFFKKEMHSDDILSTCLENVTKEEIHSDKNSSKLIKGDLVYIVTFIDVHHIFVRKVKDENDDFLNFVEQVNLYCSAETPIGKLPKLNDIIGAKSKTDGLFYRAQVVKKINEVSYNVQFFDYGIEENVHLSDIVCLSTELKEIPTTIHLVKLKDIGFCKLNKVAREYFTLISENETLIVEYIEDDTNNVILKTSENQNINCHLSMLIFENNEMINSTRTKETQEMTKIDNRVQSKFIGTCLQPGTIVYMTAFNDFNDIYIRKIDDYNDEYHNLIERVHEFCLSAVPINRSLATGEIVGALSTLYDGYYRAKVLKKNDDTSYTIRYIDFGEPDIVSISNIFEIPKDFKIPSTIIKVSLKGIESCSLSDKASQFITGLLSDQVQMTVDFDINLPLKDVTLTIINSNENLTSILDKLLKNIDNNTANNNVKNTNVTEDEVLVVTQNIKECTMPSDETNVLKTGDIVYITAYIDLCNIFVRKVNFNGDEFKKLSDRVNCYCSLGNFSESKPLELNQIVGAKSCVDGRFYRGRIIEKTDEKNYDIVFIDFGFEECVHITDIVPLTIQLQQVEPSVCLVGLKGLKFEILDTTVENYLNNLMFNNEVMKIEFEDLSAVTLTVISQEQNVVDYLNELYVDNTMINDPVQESSPYCMKYISLDISIPQIPLLTNKSIVTIYTFINLKDISISVTYNELEINKFLSDFSVFCMASQPITQTPSIGEVFGIRSTNDSFNRGEIIEILNDDQFKVMLFDFGIEEIVSANSIFEISEQLKQVPKIIYRVGLKDVNFDNLNAQAMSYVNYLCENMPLIIEFDENNPNGLNSVTLTTIKNQQNVNNHLITLLTGKEERDSPETVQMLTKGDIVYISSFVDLQSIYVRRINNGTDRFKTFLEKFSLFCSLENPIDKEPKVGEIVAAKVKKGNKFYRAEVISSVDNDHFIVCFIDFGTRATVHWSNIVQPSEKQLKICPTFMVGLDGLDSEPKQITSIQYIEEISKTDTFIIDSITEDNKVTLISVKTKCNINEKIQKLIANDNVKSKIQNNTIYVSNGDIDAETEESVIKYHKPLLEVPTQIWIAEKISASGYLVHTYDSRVEYMRLEKQMFDDSKTFEPVKSIKVNMLCIAYFSPNWYRGEILEVVNKATVRVRLIDVGNTVIRNIKEIFCIPSKYKGKSLLLNIELQPEPQEKLPITTFKIVPKRHVDNITIGEVLISPTADQSYSDLESVGLPSFSSTPIPHDSDMFQFNNHNDMLTEMYQDTEISAPYKSNNMLTIKDIQYAKWFKGASKLLTFVIVYKDCLILRDHMIDETLGDLETQIQDYCKTVSNSYSPTENELCLAKYSDGLWYRAICIKTADPLNKNLYTIYYLDWGIEYFVSDQDICEMSKEFLYLPATAHKCYIPGVVPSKWSHGTKVAMSQYSLTQVDCVIVEKLSNDSYTISCDIIKNLINANLY
ncbi:Hypothetical protein CINCED_3A022077 [Cinara cedri]|uniref:Tudor domain-containing protein n=1 Tax=Cinara cedri TaxID=506608 RepID=A0A5E4MZM2_9HEMI|nr:Hypothetical protein CINCED_3A022077 [Cinara cedri]